MRISPWIALLALILVLIYSSVKPATISRLERTESNSAVSEIIQKRSEHCRNAPYPCGMSSFSANLFNHGSHTAVLTEPTLWGEYTFVRTHQSQTDEIIRQTTRFYASRTKIAISAGFFICALIFIIRSILRQQE